jgi:GTPase SAR1 family protein
MRSSFYGEANTCALVYDETWQETLASQNELHEEITTISPEIPFVIVGNKADLLKVRMTRQPWNMPYPFKRILFTRAR